MRPFKVHIIHVGHMANKGTQALLVADVTVLRKLAKNDVSISVSTTDVEGVTRLGVPVDSVLPTVVDIPYERADVYATRLGITRGSFRYKMYALASFFYMFVQIALSAVSAMLVQVGLTAVHRSEVLARIRDCDVVVTCSDENFKESASLLPLNVYWILTWWSMLTAKTWEVLVAKLLKKNIVMFPNSIGPFRTAIGRLVSKVALNNYDFMLVREKVSYDIVRSLKIRSTVILTSDTTVLLNPTQASHKKGYTVGVSAGLYSRSLSETKIRDYIKIHAKVLDAIIEKHGFSVVFLPHYVRGFQYDDLEICRLIMGRMKNTKNVRLVDPSSVAEFRSWISRMDVMISSKMHPAVFAVSANIPTVFVAYDHKQTGFAASLGVPDCVIGLSELSYEKLLAKIEYVWSKREMIGALLSERIPELRKNVEGTITSAMTPYL